MFRGDDGLDELTTTTTSPGLGGARRRRSPSDRSTPEDVGLAPRGPWTCAAATAALNAEVARRFLAGEIGPVRDAVLLNAAAALVALEARRPSSLPDELRQAVGRAAESVDSGAAARSLAGWVETSRSLAPS